jgi:haloacetate dehalogenase
VSNDLFPGFDTRRIQTFGAEIHLRLGGEGPPLLLLHGYPQTHAMWHGVAPALAEAFTVVAPDLRGYGDSSCPPNDPDNFTYSKRAMAQDMVQVMEVLGHTVFAVAGHDRGGRVGYRMALDAPERVARLAVLDIVPTHAMWHDFTMQKAMKIYHWLFLAQPSPLPETLIGRAPGEYQDYTLASWTKRRDLSAFDARALAAYHDFFSKPEHIAAACNDYRAGQTYDLGADEADFDAGRKIACPLFALWGDAGIPDETSSPLAVWRIWATDVRGQAIDSGHFVAEENPAATLEALLAFLREE